MAVGGRRRCVNFGRVRDPAGSTAVGGGDAESLARSSPRRFERATATLPGKMKDPSAHDRVRTATATADAPSCASRVQRLRNPAAPPAAIRSRHSWRNITMTEWGFVVA